jgi:hypothetical protein
VIPPIVLSDQVLPAIGATFGLTLGTARLHAVFMLWVR